MGSIDGRMILTERTRIVSLEAEQIEELRRLRNRPEVWHNLSNSQDINETKQREWFERQAKDETKQYFAVLSVAQALLGSVWYDEWDRINSSARVGVIIKPEEWGKGYATEALNGFCNYLMGDLNIHRLWCLVLKENPASLRVFEKLGFEEEGVQREAVYRDGKYLDYVMIGKLR